MKRGYRRVSFEDIYNKTLIVFGHDKDKALSWYLTPNEIFDNLSPYNYAKNISSAKVMKMLDIMEIG